jgi:hypothetical protein
LSHIDASHSQQEADLEYGSKFMSTAVEVVSQQRDLSDLEAQPPRAQKDILVDLSNKLGDQLLKNLGPELQKLFGDSRLDSDKGFRAELQAELQDAFDQLNATDDAPTRLQVFYAYCETIAKPLCTWYGKIGVGVAVAALNTIYPSLLAGKVEVGAMSGGVLASVASSFVLARLTFPWNALVQTGVGQGLTIGVSTGMDAAFNHFNITGV